MSFRPVFSAPLPWLTIVGGKLFAKKAASLKKGPLKNWPRSLRFTREGKWFTGILLFIGIAAINTGNNLLYLIVATLLSLIIISGIMSEYSIREVGVRRALPRRIFKNKPVTVYIKSRNTKKRLSSFSLKITEHTAGVETAGGAYILRLKPGEDAASPVSYVFKARGRHKLESMRLTTRFPFGLFLKGRLEKSEDEVIVYPSTSFNPRASSCEVSSQGEVSRGVRGEGTQLYGLRDYTFEDDSRFIHWRSAARLDKLMVKEFEREAEKKVTIVFENLTPADPEVFENAVDEAATLTAKYIKKGYAVGLRTLAGGLPARSGPAQLDSILYRLALITPAPSKGAPAVRVE